ncbi:MAG: hypothetical protein K2Y51_20445 [Gammaproteobacteria bacterium]|nr:hypothetical protein [Gammaproteobacteria bacterium]
MEKAHLPSTAASSKRASRRPLRDALWRARAYFALVAWFGRLTIRKCYRPMLSSATASTLGIVLHAAALGILVRAVAAMQSRSELTHFPLLDSVGVLLPAPTTGTLLSLFVGLFAIGSVVGYVGRSIAINVECQLYLHFIDYIIERLKVAPDDVRRTVKILRRPLLSARHQLMRVLISDSRFPGVAARLALFNITHLGNIAVGLMVLAFHAPLLLPLIGAFALIAATAMYPLTLRAARTTRSLEEFSALRATYLKARLESALEGFRADSEMGLGTGDDILSQDDDDVPALATPAGPVTGDTLERYVSVLEQRLRVTELSRVTMSSMVAAGIGILVWLLYAYQDLHIASASSLLLLLFGLRFVLLGIEGSMVTLTSINRFIPHLVRLRALITDLDNEAAGQGRGRHVEFGLQSGVWQADRILPLGARDLANRPLTWRLHTPEVQELSGSLEPGTVHCITGSGMDVNGALEQFEALLMASGDASGQLVKALGTARQAVPRPTQAMELRDEDADWLSRVLSSGGQVVSPDKVRRVARLEQPLNRPHIDILRALLQSLHLACEDSPIVAVDCGPLGRLNESGQILALGRFTGQTVLLVDADVRRALGRRGNGLLFVSDGSALLCAAPMDDRPALTNVLLESIAKTHRPPPRAATA